jgi:hypothetical protein
MLSFAERVTSRQTGRDNQLAALWNLIITQ